MNTKIQQDEYYNPAKNPDAISIVKQSDGNFIGEAIRNGKLVSVRQGDPNTVLTMLITHE